MEQNETTNLINLGKSNINLFLALIFDLLKNRGLHYKSFVEIFSEVITEDFIDKISNDPHNYDENLIDLIVDFYVDNLS